MTYNIKHANKFDKYKWQFQQDQLNDLKKISTQKTVTIVGSESTCYIKASYAVHMILAKYRNHIRMVKWLRNVWTALLEFCVPKRRKISLKKSASSDHYLAYKRHWKKH